MKDEDDDLSRCKEEVEALKEENQHLRDASGAFGALAERLRDQLDVERRQRAGDRRIYPRDTPDRRGDRSSSH